MKKVGLYFLLVLFIATGCSKEQNDNALSKIDLGVLFFYKNISKLNLQCDSLTLPNSYLLARDSVVRQIDMLIVELIELSGGFSDEGARFFEENGFLDYRLLLNPENTSTTRQVLFNKNKLLALSEVLRLYEKSFPVKLNLSERITRKFHIDESDKIQTSLKTLFEEKTISESVFLFQVLIDTILKIELEYLVDNCK